MDKTQQIQTLIDYAMESGATAVEHFSPDLIVVKEELAGMCREPRCPNYGSAASCPPAVKGPEEFIRFRDRADHALFFRVDAPTEIVLSSQRVEVARLVHEIAAGMELKALESGFEFARAFAAGSCKKLFCEEHDLCRAIQPGGTCRNPDHARPSMSGFGIDVSNLVKIAGWGPLQIGREKSDDDSVMPLYGLVIAA